MHRIQQFVYDHIPTVTGREADHTNELAFQSGFYAGREAAFEQFAEDEEYLARLERQGLADELDEFTAAFAIFDGVDEGLDFSEEEYLDGYYIEEFPVVERPLVKVTHGITVFDDGRISISDEMLLLVAYFDEDDVLVLDDEALDAMGVAR